MPYDMKCNLADEACGNCHHQRPHEKADDCGPEHCSKTGRDAECVNISTGDPELEADKGAFLSHLLRRREEIRAMPPSNSKDPMLEELKYAWDAGRKYERRYVTATQILDNICQTS